MDQGPVTTLLVCLVLWLAALALLLAVEISISRRRVGK